MHATQEMINYLTKIQKILDSGNADALELRNDDSEDPEYTAFINAQSTNYCMECDEIIDWMNQGDHIIFKNNDDIIVAVCCEGFFQLRIDYKG